MIDVKLVSAASTPAQKGADAWLQTWRLGQQFSGQVLSQTQSGEALIRVGAQQITARAPFTLPTGASVRFEVSSLLPQPQLKIVTDRPAVTVAASELGQQLRVLLPLQDSVAAPLARLLVSAESAKLLSLLGLGNDAQSGLRALLPSLQQFSDPVELQAMLLNTGAFGSAASGGNDLRLALLRLLQRIAELRGQAPPAQQAAGQSQKAADSLLQSLSVGLQGALATLALNQLAMAQAGERAPYMWLFDLPYQLRGRAGSLAVSIERDREREQGKAEEKEKDKEKDKEEEEAWRVTLRLDLPVLGAIEIEIYEQAGRLSLVLRAQRAVSRQMLSDRLPELQQALAGRGLEVAVLRVYMGEYTPPAGAGKWERNVSVSV